MSDSDLEVICPLSNFLVDNPVIEKIADFSFDTSKKHIAPFLMSETTVTKTPGPKRKAESKPLGVRQILQEMRAMGDEITPDNMLSDGNRVGDFLLEQWSAKEKRRQ